MEVTELVLVSWQCSADYNQFKEETPLHIFQDYKVKETEVLKLDSKKILNFTKTLMSLTTVDI